MLVLIAFLFGTFVAAGSTRGRQLLARRGVYLAVCAVFAASFYSLRVVL